MKEFWTSIFYLLFFAIAIIISYSSYGQSIVGDTIFVNAESEVSINFISEKIVFKTTPNNAPYSFKSTPPMVSILAKTDNILPASLFITEGERTHRFVLAFKKDIDPNNFDQIFFDYSTKKKLDRHIKALAEKKRLQQITLPDTKPAEEKEQTTTPIIDAEKTNSDKYYILLEEGDKNSRLGLDDEALANFEAAHVLRPGESYPSQRIREIKAKIVGKDKFKNEDLIKDNYTKLIGEARAFFESNKYIQSKEVYQKALKLRPNDLLATRQIEKIDNILNTEKDKEKQKKLNELYNSSMSEGANALNKNELHDARIAFERALEIKNGDAAAMAQIKRVDEKEKIKRNALEMENKYQGAVQAADKLFQQEDFVNSKTAYSKALSIKDDPWPKEQILAINKKLQELNEKEARERKERESLENAEKRRLSDEKIVNEKYNSAIKKADIEFDRNKGASDISYKNAMKLYREAALLKPAEIYPKEQLQIIEAFFETKERIKKERADSIAREVELTNKYNLLFSKGKTDLLKEDFAAAQSAFEEALKIRPNNREAQTQLDITNKKLDEIELTNKYEAKNNLGDSLYLGKAYDSAIIIFKEASALKPSASYPLRQIKAINAEIKYLKDQEEINRYNDSIIKFNERADKFNTAYTKGENARVERRYSDARKAYIEALSIMPDHYGAQRGLKIVMYQLDRENEKNSNKPSAMQENIKTPENQSKEQFIYQKDAITYAPEELKVKYPGVDFFTLPPQQSITEGSAIDQELQKRFEDILIEKPRLDLNAIEHWVKLICKGITFIDKNAYFKFLIQNGSKEDFLTGAMMLTWTRKLPNGAESRIKLFPLSIYPSFMPVIKPGYETMVIYLCKSYPVASKEKLEFELMDRFEKIKLKINFSGEVYNKEFTGK